MDMIRSSETSVHTRATRRDIPEDGSIRNYRCENLIPCYPGMLSFVDFVIPLHGEYKCVLVFCDTKGEHGLAVYFDIWTEEGQNKAGGRSELHNGDLHNVYPSPSIIRTVKSLRMRVAGRLARFVRRGIRVGYWWEIQKETYRQEDNDLGWWIILKRMLPFCGILRCVVPM
jgi:hypothetical protein